MKQFIIWCLDLALPIAVVTVYIVLNTSGSLPNDVDILGWIQQVNMDIIKTISRILLNELYHICRQVLAVLAKMKK